MALFVIKNLEINKYLSIISPSAIANGSYTAKLEEARTFSTRAAAEKDACENERVYDVKDLLMPPVDL